MKWVLDVGASPAALSSGYCNLPLCADFADNCAAEDVLLSGAGVDDAAPAVAGAQPHLAQAELGPLDASQHHLQRLPAAPHCMHTCSAASSLASLAEQAVYLDTASKGCRQQCHIFAKFKQSVI